MIVKELFEGKEYNDKKNWKDKIYLGKNEMEDFNIAISANNAKEAKKIAESYRKDSDMRGVFKISPLSDFNAHVDCDYILF